MSPQVRPRIRRSRPPNYVEPGDKVDVLRAAQSPGAQHMQRSERDHVVAGDDRRGGRVSVEEFICGLLSRRHRVRQGRYDRRLVRADSCALHRVPKRPGSGDPGGHVLRAGQMGNVAVPSLQQMLDREPHAGAVVANGKSVRSVQRLRSTMGTPDLRASSSSGCLRRAVATMNPST